MSKHYIGLTIGPIIETLSKAQKTRGLWAGSYMFSYLMKTMITSMKKTGYDFLSPCYGTVPQNGAGFFHDRFIAVSENEQSIIKTDIENYIALALDSIADITCEQDSNKNTSREIIRSFYEEYIQTSCVIIPESKITNIFKDINRILDIAELQYTPIPDVEKFSSFEIPNFNPYIKGKKVRVSPLEYLQHNINKSSLLEDAYGNNKRRNFPSTVEIAGANYSGELTGKDFDFSDTDPYKDLEAKLKAENKKLYLRHKYFSIVQADGDNIGSLVEAVGDDPEKAKQFSKALFTFASTVPDIAKKYGAHVIYCGGDDILAFAPLTYGEQVIFDFMDELSLKFKETMKALETDFIAAGKVSLSFGVAAVYYKHPLYEALATSRQKLNEAKNFSLGSNQKDAIAFELAHGSGQSYKSDFQLSNQKIYSKFRELLTLETTSSSISHSLHYSLERSIGLIDSVRNLDDFPDRLKNIFDNNFNEEIHTEDKGQKGLNLARKLLQAYFEAFPDATTKEIFSRFYNALSIIKIFRGDR